MSDKKAIAKMNLRTKLLLKNALIAAEQWERSLAEAWPPRSRERQQALKLSNSYREFRSKHFGASNEERALKDMVPVSVIELFGRT